VLSIADMLCALVCLSDVASPTALFYTARYVCECYR